MTEEGSLKNSHREMSQIRLKHVNKSLHDLVLQFMEEHLEDHCIRQRLQPDKEAIVKRGQFYALPNTSRAEPGFLVFLSKQPAVWTSMRSAEKGRKPAAFSLRMRTDVTLGDAGGTVLIATLDKIAHTLRFEDVYVWKGETVFKNKSFSERRKHLKEFVEHSWTPDARLMGGIQCVVANPQPLSSLSTMTDTPFSVDLIPELAGKRRFYFITEQKQAAQVTPEIPVMKSAAQAPAAPVVAPTQKLNAFAVPLESLPDVYDLFMENGTPLCRAAVQAIALSKQLREAAARVEKIPVVAAWNKEFGRYEIITAKD
jgi:hypothetical protein